MTFRSMLGCFLGGIAVLVASACASSSGSARAPSGIRGAASGAAPDRGEGWKPLDSMTAFGITVSGHNACAWRQGQAWCWGDNSEGQLGAPATARHDYDPPPNGQALRYNDLPVRLPLENIVKVVAAGSTTCALESQGHLYCWGHREVSASTEIEFPSVRQPPSLKPWVIPGFRIRDFALDSGMLCFVTGTGEVWCEGNAEPRRGDSAAQHPSGVDDDPQQPHRVPGVANALEITLTQDKAYAKLRDGTVWSWGQRDNGNSGAREVPEFRGAREIRADFLHPVALALLANGSIVKEGAGAVALPDPIKNIRSFAVVDESVCAVLAEERVQCWSLNPEDSEDEDLEVPPEHSLRGAFRLAQAGSLDCAYLRDSVQCWGDADRGRMGIGLSTASRHVPVRVHLPWVSPAPLPVRSVLPADFPSAVSYDRWCAAPRHPAPMPPLGKLAKAAPIQAIGMALTGDSTCAWKDGHAWCWGANTEGGLGVPATDEVDLLDMDWTHKADFLGPRSCTLLPVRLPEENIMKVVSTGDSTCALDTAGRVSCWGAGNCAGPDVVPKLRVRDLAEKSMGNLRCFVTLGGEVWCQSRDLDDYGAPFRVFGITSARALLLSETQAFVLRADHTVVSWDLDPGEPGARFAPPLQDYPELKGTKEMHWDGNTVFFLLNSGRIVRNRRGPQNPAVQLEHVVTFAVDRDGEGEERGCAVIQGGTVQCWGPSDLRPAGAFDPTGAMANLFTVPLLEGASSLVLAKGQGCAWVQGSLMCWGNNRWGQLGVGTAIPQSLPVRVQIP